MGNTSIQTQSYRAVDKDAGQSRSYIIPFALLCSLFFLWAVANNLNDILLPQFQQAFTLTNFQAGLIQSAFYFGYFIIPIPAGILMKKLSYKAGIITGLFLYALGAAFLRKHLTRLAQLSRLSLGKVLFCLTCHINRKTFSIKCLQSN